MARCRGSGPLARLSVSADEPPALERTHPVSITVHARSEKTKEPMGRVVSTKEGEKALYSSVFYGFLGSLRSTRLLSDCTES